MKQTVRRRKPKNLEQLKMQVYAGIDPTDKNTLVYIGGPYYGDSAQIHVPAREVRRLAEYLLRAAEYLEGRGFRE